MQSFYAEQFDREMSCTVAEWQMWLPAAMGDAVWTLQGNAVHASWSAVPDTLLDVTWHAGEPRRIAQIVLPRLHVHFGFTGLSDTQRYAFMKRFDLYMQRGGG